MAKPNKDSLKTLSFITYFIILFVFWFILSGYLKTLLLFFGVISVLFVFWMSYRAKALEEDSLPLKIILRLPFYWIWLFKEIFKSAFTKFVKKIIIITVKIKFFFFILIEFYLKS